MPISWSGTAETNSVLRILLRFLSRADEKGFARSSTKMLEPRLCHRPLEALPCPLSTRFSPPIFFFYYEDDDDEEGLGHFTLAAFHHFSPRLPRQPFANFPERPPPSALVHRLLFSPQRMSSAPFSRSRYANFSPKPSSWPFSPFPNTRLLLPPNSFVLIFFARFSVVSIFFFFFV